MNLYNSLTDEELMGEARVSTNPLATVLAERLKAKLDEGTSQLPDWIKQVERAHETVAEAELVLEQLMREMENV